MERLELAAAMLAAVVAWIATWGVRRQALSRGIFDLPNVRSSHTRPTPRGGGLAIVISLATGLWVLWAGSAVEPEALVALGVGGLAIAAVGFVDDVRGVAVLPRFCVHVIGAAVGAFLLLRRADAGHLLSGLPFGMTMLLLVTGIVWCINLFNFMDGIDGLAASQAVFVSAASAVLMTSEQGETDWDTLAALTAGASLGFLVWNRPPAKIFMGDTGSGFLGFWLAVLAIGFHLAGVLSVWTSIVLGSVFIADATATLLRRVVLGERWYEAHRSHAYQHLARKWNNHLKVTGLAWALNLSIVLPLAYATTVWHGAAPWLAVGTVGSLSLGCLRLGAGKPSA